MSFEDQFQCTCPLGLVQCQQEGRPEQVTCHFDLEHDQLDWCACHVEPIQGVELQCHRVSHAGAVEGSVCTFQEGCQTHGTSPFDPGHEEGAEAFSGPKGVVPVFPIHRTLGFRPFPV